MASTTLEEQFLRSVRPFNLFLKSTGIYLYAPCYESWSGWIEIVWSGFWITLNLQSALFMFLERGLVVLKKIFEFDLKTSKMDSLNSLIVSTSPLIFSVCTQIDLILTLQQSIKLFMSSLQLVDARLGNGRLLPNIHRYSLVAVLLTVSKVSILQYFIQHIKFNFIKRLDLNSHIWLVDVCTRFLCYTLETANETR